MMCNEDLVRLIQGGEDTTNNMLILWQQNQGYIIKVVKRYQYLGELDDLMQEAYISLARAVSQYDQEKSDCFMTYASYWIKHGLQRYSENCGSIIRLPSHMAKMVLKYNAMVHEYKNRYGTELTDEQMISLLNVSGEKLHSIQKAADTGRMCSLNMPLNEDEEGQLMDLQASAENLEEDVIKRLDMIDMKQALFMVVDLLGERNKEVLRLRYWEGKTLREIGSEVGVTFSHVRCIENECMKKLRLKKDNNMVLRRYYEDYIAPTSFKHVPLQSFKYTWTSQPEREAMRGM